jgi:tRNA pseudouridine55 synthase
LSHTHSGGLTPDGVILVDKPSGKTSHDVVAAVRRASGKARTGHAGTLDPFATGLLLILVGRATRIQRYLMALPKTYVTVAQLGAVSTTGDPEGDITVTGVLPPDPPSLPTGRTLQRPPAYSAVKTQGVRAYARARRGETVELPEREVEVTRFEQRWRRGDQACFEIECSSGTYVRSLVEALGDAYCVELRRTAVGPFRVEDTDPERILPLTEALAFMPTIPLGGDDARHAEHGVAVAGDADGPVLLVDAHGPIAVAEPREGRLLKPVVGFRG